MDVGARFTPPVRTAPTVDYSKLTASGKGSWNIELKTSFTDALNAGLAEGLGHIKTSIAGVGKMVAESKPTVKGIAVPPQPELAKKFDAAISSTESWIKQYEPESMTTFQALAKDLVSGGVSIFSSIGIGLLTGGAGSSAVLFGLLQAGDKYAEERKAGVSAERAGGIATAQGFVEASLEFIGLDSFLKMRNGTVWNTLIRAGTEAVQEASQSFGENLLDTVWDKDQKLQEGVGRSALIGGLLGLPAAVSVSSYEQSSEYGQAVKRVAELGPEYAKRAEAIVQGIVQSVNEKVVPLVDETLQEARKSITLPDFQSVLGVQKTAPLKTTSGMGALVGQPQTVSGGTKPSPRFHLALAESNRQGVPVGEAVTKSQPPAPVPTRIALPAPSITQGIVAPSVQESDWGERSGTTGLRTTTHEISYTTKEGIQKRGILVEDSEGNLYGVSKLEPTPVSSPPVAISTQETSVSTPPIETAPQIAPTEIVQPPAAQIEPTVSKMEMVGTEWDSPSGIRRVVGETTVNGEKRLVVQTGDQRIGQILLPADQLQSEMAGDAKNLAFRKNEQEIANAPKAQPTYGEYVSSMPPMQRAKVSAALQKNITSNGVLQARSVLVEKWVAEGATVVQKADQRELTKPSGNYLLEKDLSKTAMDYAEWLINTKPAPVSKMETPPSTEQSPVVPFTRDSLIGYQEDWGPKQPKWEIVGFNKAGAPLWRDVNHPEPGRLRVLRSEDATWVKEQLALKNRTPEQVTQDETQREIDNKKAAEIISGAFNASVVPTGKPTVGKRVTFSTMHGEEKGTEVSIPGVEKYRFAAVSGKEGVLRKSVGDSVARMRKETVYHVYELSSGMEAGHGGTKELAVQDVVDKMTAYAKEGESLDAVMKRSLTTPHPTTNTIAEVRNPQYVISNLSTLPAGQTTSGQEVTPSYVSNEPNLATSGTSTAIPADNDTINRITVAFDQIEEHLGEKKSDVKAVEGTFQSAFAKFLHEAGIPKGALSWEQALDWYKASRGEKSFAKRVEMVKRAVAKYNLGIEQQQRTSIIGEISSLQAKSKSGVYALAQEELDSLLGKYRKSKLSKKHKASLEASRAYFAEHPDQDLPANLADEISLLDKETLKGMSVKELTALREKVRGILSSGKEAYREWKKRNELKQTLYKKSVLARAKSLGGATSENIGTVMTRWQKLYQDALAIDETLEPTDVWMNQLGLMNEKRRFDDKYNHFLFVTRHIKSVVADLMAKNHLTMEDRQKIKLFQIVRMGREDLIAPIAEHLKMTAEQAGNIVLTEGQKEVLDYMDSQYKTFFPIVQDYLARVKNQTIHQEESYAPLLADPNALGNDTIESNAVTFYHNTKTISADSVRAREQLHYLTTSDAVSDFERYVTDMQYMIEMGELTKRLSEVVNSKEFQAKAGVLGQSILSDWLDTMARRGGASGEQRIRILDLLRKNTNTGYMTAKLGTVFVQFTAIADGFNEIGIKWMVAGAERQVSPEWRSLMKDFAAEVYGNEADPDFTEPTWWKGLVKGLRTPVVAADAVVRRTVFLGAYARACERLGLAGTVEEFSSSDKEVKQNIREALAEATQVTRKAQGTSEFKDQPLSISRGRIGNLIKNRSVGKLMTQFQSFNFFRFSNIKDTIWTSGIKKGRLDKALGGIFWLLLVASMSEVLLRRGARWISSGGKTSGEATDKITVGLKDTIEDTFNLDPSWLTQLTAETFSGLVDNIPFMGQLVGMMMYGKDPLPVADAIIKFSQGMGSIVNGASGTTKLRGVAGIISAGGSLAGVPGSAQVGGTLRDVITTKKKPKFKFTLPY
jgi:hypothetical protein